MTGKSFLSISILVALVYLASYACAATTTTATGSGQWGTRTPTGKGQQQPKEGGPPGGRTRRWIDLTARAITHLVETNIPRQARTNIKDLVDLSGFGLDSTEMFKQLMVKVLEWMAWVITELVHL